MLKNLISTKPPIPVKKALETKDQPQSFNHVIDNDSNITLCFMHALHLYSVRSAQSSKAPPTRAQQDRTFNLSAASLVVLICVDVNLFDLVAL